MMLQQSRQTPFNKDQKFSKHIHQESKRKETKITKKMSLQLKINTTKTTSQQPATQYNIT